MFSVRGSWICALIRGRRVGRVPYVRTVKTASGATAVQIVYSSHRGSRDIEHIGSAHDDAELELLKAAARQRLAAGQGELDLGLDAGAAGGGPLPITASRMGCLLDALEHAYRVLGFDRAAGGDEVFRAAGAGADHRAGQQARLAAGAGGGRGRPAVVLRRSSAAFPSMRRTAWRQQDLRGRAPPMPGWARRSLVLYDVSTLYFETDEGDGFRESGFSKERRLEPQITIGLLTGAGRVPADGVGVRGEQGRDQDHAAGHRGVHGRAPAAGRHGRRGRRHGLARRTRSRSRPRACRSSSA